MKETDRVKATDRVEGDRPREGAGAERMEHLRAAVEHLHAAGLHDLAEQVARQIGRPERGAVERREGERREGERREGDGREGDRRD